MEGNFQERLADIQDLQRMLDTVANEKQDEIIKGNEVITNIIRHDNLKFNVKQNGQSFEVTKNVYEVLVEKNGELYHEFYDDQGNKIMDSLPDKTFSEGKVLSELENGEFDDKSLLANVYKDQDSKSLEELEQEQSKEVAEVLGVDEKTAKELNLVDIDLTQGNPLKDDKINEAQEKLQSFMALGMTIDTNELATSDDTIKEFLNLDTNRLLLIQINGTWKTFKIDDKGNLALEPNLQALPSNQSFRTIGDDGNPEMRTPEMEFYNKANPDRSLAIDSHNDENQTKLYLVAGNSRSASEIETTSCKSPYADVKNNELVQKAQENPDKENLVEEEKKEEVDPHEPSLEPGANSHN